MHRLTHDPSKCATCTTPLRADNVWCFGDRLLCDICAYEEDPDFVEEMEADDDFA